MFKMISLPKVTSRRILPNHEIRQNEIMWKRPNGQMIHYTKPTTLEKAITINPSRAWFPIILQSEDRKFFQKNPFYDLPSL